MLEELEVSKDRVVSEMALLKALGLSASHQDMIHDLALNAVSKAMESLKIVARTAPDQNTAKVVMLVAGLLIGEACSDMIITETEKAFAGMTQKEKSEVVERADKLGVQLPESLRSKGKRDFDGNYL